jgi:uncharacterized damage-inducible protein DinB
MQPFFAEYLRILETMHGEFAKAVEGLSEEALDWSSDERVNSLAVLAVHTAGAERFWIGSVAMNEPLERDRPGKFLTKGLSSEEILDCLQHPLSYARAALERLGLEDLSAARTSPRDGRQVTVAWALLHALEHTSVHVGHAQLTRQLWEAQAARR